ncbi:bifunctional folylpolyglutamate synthase/dihydrofolate synthase [Oceanobacillus rekensis]|uniref:bifunctional folylpolyglutamate synthase/dihydrofolate synthase n=1 Tax=Oceanobacillus rekensis TaxID=937927 RepID=UPI000B4427D9|nr:folylpolyglutamate synthase/dihydrofolate synthase family protein [Oceanobacillus rekensis]
MFTTFQEVERFFDSRKSLGIKPGLERVNRLLALLDHPQKKMKAIHIAGTNGKGSTVEYMNKALQVNGYQVGIFTSPSLSGLTGHIYLNDREISKEEFLNLCNTIYPKIKQMDKENLAPTEFEIITVLGFLYFSTYGDITLIEAGMGGREDTTNCFQPIISIITNIAKDHTKFLGDTIAEIAYQKAGIIKKNAPVITGTLETDALAVIKKEVTKKETAMYRLGEDFFYQRGAWQQLTWKSNQRQLETRLAMFGEHQAKNASVAYMALEKLSETGLSISFAKAADAIASTQLAGRFEIVSRDPVIVLDGSHNPAGIAAFLSTVEENFPNSDKHILFAAFKDKDLKAMLKQLDNKFESITLTSFCHPRAASAEQLFSLTQAKNKQMNSDWEQAVKEMIDKQSGYYFITGSLHFISNVRKYFLLLS